MEAAVVEEIERPGDGGVRAYYAEVHFCGAPGGVGDEGVWEVSVSVYAFFTWVKAKLSAGLQVSSISRSAPERAVRTMHAAAVLCYVRNPMQRH